MADLKFISLFNDIVINAMHIRWCEKIRKHYCGEDETFGIRIAVNTGRDWTSFEKYFNTQEDRDKEFNRLSDNLLGKSIE